MVITKQQFDIIVVGAGMVGAAFALLMAKRAKHLRIAVVERNIEMLQPKQANQRVVALGSAATRLLDEVGVYHQLNESSCHPYSKMAVWDENTDGKLTFSAQELGQTELGCMVDSVQCGYLLQAAMQDCINIDVFYNFEAQSLDFEKQQVSLSGSGLTLQTTLVVAADGSNSWVRQQAKIFAPEQGYKQSGIVAKISTELDHEDTAWQRFLTTGPLAILPLVNNQSSIVWSADDDYAKQLMAMSEVEFGQAIAVALGQRLGKVSLLSKRIAVPLKSQHAERYFKNCLALIGDAAHSVHPLAGQGVNLGFKDVAALVAQLQDCEVCAAEYLEALAKYQRDRMLDNRQTDFLMSVLHKAYQANTLGWLRTRSIGMNWLDEALILKKVLARQAIGF